MQLFKEILIPALCVAAIALFFGILLAVASRIFSVTQDQKLEQVRKLLPGSNCGGCGYAGCDTFARELCLGSTHPNACAGMTAENAGELSKLLGFDNPSDHTKRPRAFVICKGNEQLAKMKYIYEGIEDCSAETQLGGGRKECLYGCLGLGNCIKKCPQEALYLDGGVARVRRDLCTGCGACVSACPKKLIRLIPVTTKYMVACGSCDKGVVTKERCAVGCIGCGICKKNCPEGAITVENGLASINPTLCVGCGLCAEKCPRKIIYKLALLPLDP